MTPTDTRRLAIEKVVLPALGTAFTMALLLTRDETLAQERVEQAVATLIGDLEPAVSAAEVRARFFREVVRGWLERAPAEGAIAVSGVPAEDVGAAIQTLPPEYRLPVAVYFAGRFPYHEIASIVGRPVEWVRDRLHAGRRMLRRELTGMAMAG